LEEERERELETLYESGIADALNAPDVAIGGAENDTQTYAETTAVTKQTTETLMAGERIIEALDLADGERSLFREYEEEKSRMSADDAIKLQPPPRNPVLAAYDIEPEAWVLRVVEKVQSTALQDALLVLPFGKVVSLMGYLNIWAQRVCLCITDHFDLLTAWIGMEYYPRLAHNFLPIKDTSPPDRR
jgi:U3 small nucleolar RNA-associated protein 12